MVGFTDLGNCDDFSTEMLEWRIAQSGAIEYDGDLLTPPDIKKASSSNKPQNSIHHKNSHNWRDNESDLDDD